MFLRGGGLCSPQTRETEMLASAGIRPRVGHQPNMKTNPHAPIPRTVGFTLIEIAVIVAVLGVLGCLWMTSAFKNSRQLKRAQCAANLRQFAAVTHIYSSEHRDRLPEMNSGAWAWDVPVAVTSAMMDRGMERKHFYCPGTSPRFDDNLNFLNPAPSSLWNYFGTSYRIIGYLPAFTGPASNPTAFRVQITNQNTTIVSERVRVSVSVTLNAPPNSERVLLADATISENLTGTASNPAPAGSFVNVPGGFPVASLSPHLKGTLPAGGNLAFKDGHVAWRNFSEMSQRASGSSRGFWW